MKKGAAFMPKVSVNLTEEQHQELQNLAGQAGISLTDFVLQKLPITQEKKLQLRQIENAIASRQSGDFTIPSLFSLADWDSFSSGSRRATPKAFYKKVLAGDYSGITFKGKNSANLAHYNKR